MQEAENDRASPAALQSSALSVPLFGFLVYLVLCVIVVMFLNLDHGLEVPFILLSISKGDRAIHFCLLLEIYLVSQTAVLFFQ